MVLPAFLLSGLKPFLPEEQYILSAAAVQSGRPEKTEEKKAEAEDKTDSPWYNQYRFMLRQKRRNLLMKLVITMSRRFGTGASVIAKELSDRLGIPVYDKAYIEEQLSGHRYENEAEAIRRLAQQPCIILGRCASDILKGRPDVFNIFIRADKEDRIRRIMEKEDLTYEQAKEKVERTDEKRASYYYEHTGKTWGDVNDYHMILDTSELGVENCADILMRYFTKMEYI